MSNTKKIELGSLSESKEAQWPGEIPAPVSTPALTSKPEEKQKPKNSSFIVTIIDELKALYPDLRRMSQEIEDIIKVATLIDCP